MLIASTYKMFQIIFKRLCINQHIMLNRVESMQKSPCIILRINSFLPKLSAMIELPLQSVNFQKKSHYFVIIPNSLFVKD